MSLLGRQLAIWSAGLLLSLPAGLAATAPGTSGTIVGVVKDPGGVAQIGATVLLYNRFEKLIERVLTNDQGQFGFEHLLPDTYSIRVNLTTFMPAVRTGILVQPGMRSFLAINLASVLSSVEFVYASPAPPRLLSDDWRWVLRSSMSTRPVLRFVEDMQNEENVFTNTHGLVRLSAGDGADPLQRSQPDLGTAFAVATSLYGVNNVEVSGNLGYVSRAGLPTASFRTRYSRDSIANGMPVSSSPEVQLTVRQIFLPTRAGAFMNGPSAPSLGTMAALAMDRVKIGDDIEVLYGAQLESVRFIERVNVLSPFARADIALGRNTSMRAAWSSGTAPDELFLTLPGASADTDLQRGLSTLSAFPRVSIRDGHAHVQRMEQAELTIFRNVGQKTQVALSGYYENVANAALMAVGDTRGFATGEMLPDLFTRASIFNIGSYRRHGVMAGLQHQFFESLSAHAAFGNSGTLQPDGGEIRAGNAGDLRSALRRTQRNWISLRVAGAVPVAGTRISAGYLITDYRAALPAHRFMTQRISPDLGFNVQVRQPLPALGLWAGRLEAVAELRNLAQQGYLPIQSGNGRRVTLVPSPRSVRGGLAFIF